MHALVSETIIIASRSHAFSRARSCCGWRRRGSARLAGPVPRPFFAAVEIQRGNGINGPIHASAGCLALRL